MQQRYPASALAAFQSTVRLRGRKASASAKADSALTSREFTRQAKTLLYSLLAILLCLSWTPADAQTPPAGWGNLEIAGSNWMGGQGVNAYWNGAVSFFNQNLTYSDPNNTPYGQSINTGVKWQCVELPQRLYTERGWHKGVFPGVAVAADIWNVALSMGMEQHPNGSGYVPVPGDMIIHGTAVNGGTGHVSVVDYVDSNNVHIVEQNVSTSGQATYSRSGPNGSTLSRSLGNILGVVHSLNNSNTNGGPGNDIYVNLNNGSSGNGSSGNPFQTVIAAVNAANASQSVTIHIAPGWYHENVSTSKKIHIVTWGSGTVRIGG